MKKNTIILAGLCMAALGLCVGVADVPKMGTGCVCAATSNQKKAQTFKVKGITYQVSGKKTVTAIDIEMSYNILVQRAGKPAVDIPSKVSYKGKTYTVTSVEMKNVGREEIGIEKIIIPQTITKNVIIKCEGEPVLSEWAEVPFEEGNTFTVKFKGKTPPKKVFIETERKIRGGNLIFEVPDGTVKQYKKVIGDVTRYSLDPTIDHIKVPADVISNKDKNPQLHYFKGEGGYYLVEKKAEGEPGSVKLISHYYRYDCDDLEPGTYSMLSQIKQGKYTYNVTSIAKGAFDKGCTGGVLTIPDTVTELESYSLPSQVNGIVLSKNIKKLPANVFAKRGCKDIELLYAPWVEEIENGAFDGIYSISNLIVGQNVVVPENETVIDHIKYITPITTGAAIVAPECVEVNIGGEKKKIEVSFDGDTNEHLQYLVLSSENNYYGPGYLGVSEDGELTAKKAGIKNVLLFSLESGKHTTVKVQVKNTLFTEGNCTYALNYSKNGKKTVTLKKCVPTSTDTTLTLPSTVIYEGESYEVTGAYGNEEYQRPSKKKELEYLTSIFSSDVTANSNITKIIIPATMTNVIHIGGKFPKLQTIQCEAKVAPDVLCYYAEKTSDVTVEVPEKAYEDYKTAVVMSNDMWEEPVLKKY